MTRDPALVKLAAEVVLQAMRDAGLAKTQAAVPVRTRGEPLAWLASKAASPYFDAANIDQQSALDAMGWAPAARRALSGGAELRRDERRVIQAALKVVGPRWSRAV